jgi:hypothetical protein
MVLTSDAKTVRSLLQHLQFAKADAFRTWQYSNTLRVPGFEDSLSDEAHGLCCQPLEIGLASEARSTTRTLAKSEGRERSAL